MKAVLVLSTVLALAVSGLQAQVVLNNTDGNETPDKTWSIADLNNPNPTVTSLNGITNGTFSGAGNFSAAENFSITASARHGWNTAAAQSAAANGTFSAYLDGLASAGIGALSSGGMGVDSSHVPNATDSDITGFTGTSEVMVFAVDAGSLEPASRLSLTGIRFDLYTAADRTDFVVWDSSAQTFIDAQWNESYDGPDAVGGNWSLEDGDLVIVATSSAHSDKYRVATLTLDITKSIPDGSAPTPHPATWASPPMAIGPYGVTMTATTGDDPEGVEYSFHETTGHPGATDSGWQKEPFYTDTGLAPGTEYTYAVTMRDREGHTGNASVAASATTFASGGRTGGPPNVVIIYADDLGNADISRNRSSASSLVHTPNIDRICNEGIYLKNYMTHHVCSPSRAGLLTGRHYTEVGVGAQTGGTLDNSIPNIAKDFRAGGYATACFGKWHNGSPPYSNDGSMVKVGNLAGINTNDLILQYLSEGEFGEGVNAYGFDEWAGYYGGGHNYHTRIGPRDVDWWINRRYAAEVAGYNTYLIRDSALGFIDANAHQPFFLYVPMEAVHGPNDILNTDLEEMCNIVSAAHPTLSWSAVKELRSPTTGRRIEEVLQMRCDGGQEFPMDTLEVSLPGFADLVYYTIAYAMDKSTGDILNRLAAYGLTDNTIVVFTSDNGGTATRGDNFPFKGSKNTLWEGGIHVPAALWWPGTFDAATLAPYAPGDNDYVPMSQYIDLYPTLMAMAGQTLTATELDGLNLYPFLLSRTPARSGFDNCYFGLDETWAAVRNDRWKLHFNRVPGNQKLELYDLVNDIGETQNVQAANPTERDTLIGLMDAWFATRWVTASYMPVTGESVPPYTAPAPFGDILEVKATQNRTLSSNTDKDGVYIRFADPDFGGGPDAYAHAGDVLTYDIYVAQDSQKMSGLFCSPSTGASPIYNSGRGITPDGRLVSKQTLPQGQWVRVVAGMGEVAPNTSYASFVALHNSAPGYYHFYIDNLSVRKEDGTVRGVAWDNRGDTRSPLWYLWNGATYSSWAATQNATNFPFTDVTLSTVDLGTLPSEPVLGSNYNAWAAAIGGGIEAFDPGNPGPVNRWPVLLEYGLGTDPATPTAGVLPGNGPPASTQLGSYAFRNLTVDGQDKNYLTMEFNFNREANDVEIVLAESKDLFTWEDSLVLQPPFDDTNILFTSNRVVEVQDNPDGSPVETTRVIARGSTALEDGDSRLFLTVVVRPLVAAPGVPSALSGRAHYGVLLEWVGDVENGEFIIQRAPPESGVFQEIARTANRLYTDETAVAGQTYLYRVNAVNAAGATAWSNVVAVTR